MSLRHFSQVLAFFLLFSTLASCYAVSPSRPANQYSRGCGTSKSSSTHLCSTAGANLTVEAGLDILNATHESIVQMEENEGANSKHPSSPAPGQLDLRKRQSENEEENPFPNDSLEMFVCHILTPCVTDGVCEAFTEGWEGLTCSCHAHHYELGHRRYKFVGRCWDTPSLQSLEDLLPRDLGDGSLLTPSGACFCNGSYVSAACCGVRGGIVWEAPGLALLDSAFDSL